MEAFRDGGEEESRKVDFPSFFLLSLTHIMITLRIRMTTSLLRLSRIRQRIGQLTRQRREVERVLLGRSVLVKGVLVKVQRTCGKAGCKCARGQKHTCWQLSASVEGKVRTQNVPRRYVGKVAELTKNYRRFRQARAKWVRLNREVMKWINEMEAARTIPDFREEGGRQKK